MKKAEKVEIKLTAVEKLEALVGKFEDEDALVAKVEELKKSNDRYKMAEVRAKAKKKIDVGLSTVSVPEIGSDGTVWYKFEVSLPEELKNMVEQASFACSVTPKEFVTAMLMQVLTGRAA